MNKQEFFDELANQLSSLPQAELEKSMAYYSEIVDDRIEDGMSEEEAIKALGDINIIVKNTINAQSIPALMMAKIEESKARASSKGLWIALVVLGFPLWFPLIVTFGAVLFTLYMVVWVLIFAMYTVVLGFGVSGAIGLFGGVVLIFTRTVPIGLCGLGVSLICSGITILLIKPVFLSTKGLIQFTANVLARIKGLFITRREAK